MEQDRGKSCKPHDICSSLWNPWWWASEFKGFEWLSLTAFTLSPTTPPNVPCPPNYNEIPVAGWWYAFPYLKPLGPDVIWNSEIFRFYRSVIVHVACYYIKVLCMVVYLIINTLIFLQLNVWILTLMGINRTACSLISLQVNFIANHV